MRVDAVTGLPIQRQRIGRPPLVSASQAYDLRLDPLSVRRMRDAGEFIRERIGTPVSNSAVVRRALHVYAEHLEGLHGEPEGSTALVTEEAMIGRAIRGSHAAPPRGSNDVPPRGSNEAS